MSVRDVGSVWSMLNIETLLLPELTVNRYLIIN